MNSDFEVEPNLGVATTYHFNENITGKIQYSTTLNMNALMHTGFTYVKDNLSIDLDLKLSIKDTHLRLGGMYKVDRYLLNLHTSMSYGFLGTNIEYGINKQISKFTNVDASINISTLNGVVLDFK
jgi:hypothetical protein